MALRKMKLEASSLPGLEVYAEVAFQTLGLKKVAIL